MVSDNPFASKYGTPFPIDLNMLVRETSAGISYFFGNDWIDNASETEILRALYGCK
jgi:hypothetical protein